MTGPSLARTSGAGPLLLALLAARPAVAQGPERAATAVFAVPRDPSGQKAAAAVGAVLRARLPGHPKLGPIDPGRVLSGDPRTREEEMLDRARAALADGRRAYDALSLDDAIARLGQAISLYQQTGPLLGDLSELKTALGLQGAALTLRGSTDEGAGAFSELLTLDPSYTPSGFPPQVMRVFDRAVDRLNEATRGSVEVYSTPPFAAVFIDGELRGVTPLSLESISAGTHYLRLERDGHVSFGGPLEIAPKQRITSQTVLRDIKSGAQLRDLLSRTLPEIEGEEMGGKLRELARMLLADTLIVVAVSQSGRDASLTGAAFDAKAATRLALDRAVVPVESAEFDREVGALADRLMKAAADRVATGGAMDPNPGDDGAAFGLGANKPQTTPGGPTPGYTVRGEGRRADDGPSPSLVIGWTLVGVGGAALVNAVVFAVLAKDVHQDFRNTSQASPDLVGLQDTGRDRALVADISYIGGGVLAAGGIFALIWAALERPTPNELLGARAAIVPLEDGAILSLGGPL